jgi:hypothetical protein
MQKALVTSSRPTESTAALSCLPVVVACAPACRPPVQAHTSSRDQSIGSPASRCRCAERQPITQSQSVTGAQDALTDPSMEDEQRLGLIPGLIPSLVKSAAALALLRPGRHMPGKPEVSPSHLTAMRSQQFFSQR